MATATALVKESDSSLRRLRCRCELCCERVRFFRVWWQSQALLKPGKERPLVHPNGLWFDLALFPIPNPNIVIDAESENILWNPQPIKSWFIGPLVGSVPEKWEDADSQFQGRIFEAIPPFTEYAKKHWCDAGPKEGESIQLAGARVPSELEGEVDPASYRRFNLALSKVVKPRSGKALSKAIDKALRKLAVRRKAEEKKTWKSGRLSNGEKVALICSTAVQSTMRLAARTRVKKLYARSTDGFFERQEQREMVSLIVDDATTALGKKYCSDGRDKKGVKAKKRVKAAMWRSGRFLVDGKELEGKIGGLHRLAFGYATNVAKRTMGKEWEQYRTQAFAPVKAATAVAPESESKTYSWRKAPPDGCIEWNEDRSKRRWPVLPDGRKFPLVSDSFVPMSPACIPEGSGSIDLDRFSEPVYGNLKLRCDKHCTEDQQAQEVKEIDMLGTVKLACGCVRDSATHVSEDGQRAVWPRSIGVRSFGPFVRLFKPRFSRGVSHVLNWMDLHAEN